MSTDEKAKSCTTCLCYKFEIWERCYGGCYDKIETKNVTYKNWISASITPTTLTPAQQYAPELLEALKEEHKNYIDDFEENGTYRHERKTCLTCQLIAKAEGRE